MAIKPEELSSQEKLNRQADLANMVVHDLKGPLMEMMANLDLLVNSAEISEMDKEFAQTAMEGCTGLLDLVTDLLNLGKMESGMLRLEKTAVDITQMLRDELKKVRLTAEDTRVAVELEGNNTVMAEADGKLIRRVVANLVSNGLKFSPPGTKLRVSVADTSAGVKVTVKDEGPGIPPNYRASIFDKYTQVDLRTHKQPGGTGLGLTFCKMAVEAHGGTIGLEEVSNGSQFYFVIPKNGKD